MGVPSISIIIPVYKDLSGLAKTVESIFSQTYQDYEIIVINDGADPDIEKYCKEHQLQTAVISPNRGSYNARNEGIKISKAEYIAFTDADLLVNPDWLERGLQGLKDHDYVAGNVVIPEELIVDIATFHDFCTSFPIQTYFNNHHFGVTANLFVRKAIFKKVGNFDSLLKSGGDMEFGDRVHRARLSQIYLDDCVVKHPPRSHDEKLIKMKRVLAGQVEFLNKYPERFGHLRKFFIKDGGIRQVARDLAPPRISYAKKLYKKGYSFSFFQFYAYMYKLKIHSFYFNFNIRNK